MPMLYECSRCRKMRYPKGFGTRGKKCMCRRNPETGRKPNLDRKGTKRRGLLYISWRPGTTAAQRRAAEKVT